MKLKDLKIEDNTNRVLEGEVLEKSEHTYLADDDDFFEALSLLNDVSIALAQLLDKDTYSIPKVTEEALKILRDDIEDFHRSFS